ncbi:sulfotransferase [Humitalea sp. 24SJ18S-53]|uniref:sulfotransferase n=1 Tax=Humitalea sp. 24SJ18S-53 TaxID=3422307 RepID=UPI003D67C871
MIDAPVLFVVGPARSGITVLAEALGVGVPQRDVLAELARIAALAAAGGNAARRAAAIGRPTPPSGLTPRVTRALLEDLLGPERGKQVLRAAEWLPEAGIMPGLRFILPQLPKARVVILHRDGVQTVNSRLRTEPRLDFVQHCLSWTAAMEAGVALRAACPSQVIVLGHRALLNTPAESLAKLGAFARFDDAVAARIQQHLLKAWPERSGMDPATAGPGLADVAWSTPEKLLFLDICGDAMRKAGYGVGDAAALLRRAPLRVSDLAASGRLRLEGIEPDWPRTEAEGTLRLSATTGGAAIAVWHGIALAGRRRLTGRLRALPQNAPGFRMQIDVLGTLTRQLVMTEAFDLAAGASINLGHRLRDVPEMVDLVVSVAAGQAVGQGVDLCDVTLSLG